MTVVFKKIFAILIVMSMCSVSFAVSPNQIYPQVDISQETLLVIMLVLLLLFLVAGVMFIVSQQKLATNLTTANGEQKIHGIWFWTQLIPLWNIVALIVTQVKINEQYKIFMHNHSSQSVGYSITLFYWYLGLSLVGLVPIVGVFASLASMIVFIMFWVKMSKATKQINAILDVL